MKLSLALPFLLVATLQVSASAIGQEVTLQRKNVKLDYVLKELQKQSGYNILFDQRIVPQKERLTVNYRAVQLHRVLDEVLTPFGIKYHENGKNIVLSKGTISHPQPVLTDQQQAIVKGKVQGTDGAPIAGVTVRLNDGAGDGALTGQDGTFSITARPQDRLTFSYVGKEPVTVTIGERKELLIVLKDQSILMDDLVVVAYGQQKKRNLTGSVVSVGSDEIEKTTLQDPISILQGRAPGVQITSNSGAPGGEMTIRVRGNSSLNAGNNPLFVVDGVPIESNSLSSLNGTENFGLNPLADINPDDIASIEILKDASSTAIYGSRAANGVVLITTKRGAEGKAQITANFMTGVSAITRHLSVLNASQYRAAVIDSYNNMDNPEEPYWTVLDSLNPSNNGDIDWQRELLRSAAQYKVDLAVRGGTDKVQYSWSNSYLDQDGIIISNDYKRITSRLNVDFKVTDRLKIGQSLAYTNATNNRINAGGTGNLSVIRELLVRPPVMSMYFPDGSLNGYQLGRRNPVGIAMHATHYNKSHRIIGSEYVEYDILEGLSFRSNLHFDFITMKENEFMPSILDYREGYNTGGVRNTNNITWANENILRYNKMFSNKHNFGALLGFSLQDWRYERTGLDGMFFPSDDIRTLNAASVISNKDSEGQDIDIVGESAMLSYFGRASYDYLGKYLAEVNLRTDGSSRFGRDRRFGFFPSASVGWRFTDETFLKGIQHVINDGKIRFSMGSTGNHSIGNYTSQGEFLVGRNYLGFSGAAPSVMPNASLTWETTVQYNAGLDLSFLANRITLNADYYIKNTRDLLYSVPIPTTTGFSTITQNIGNIQNKGVEFLLSTKNLIGDFGWTTNFNISANRNKIVSLPEELLTNGYIQNGAYHILKEGQPIGIFYGWRFDGVYARDEDNVNGVTHGASGPLFKGGDPIWHDLNGDEVINQDDRQIIGNAEPKFFGGISNDFSYKNFSLNVLFQYSYGNDIYSEINHQRNTIVRYNNLSTDALRRWRQQGDMTDYPKPVRDDPMQSESRVQSRWVEDGSYIKLKNVNLRYRFSPTWIKRAGIRSLEAFVTGTNLITWTRYTGFDPDVNSYAGLRVGVDEGSYPQSRTFVFGINIGL
ncbi:TonB-dependent receptor [Parapedobacter sp. SGR-10]|uniref:SusC/RagA family TonB-linked outer membrane protein n=1 Tax=Parapedobacter sp. SGR-10 TaxID=2710879 RepID=UPI0013D2C14F|nr:TonB-dependent receptor [Parapedobacter sp. SGR-10]NGF56212.1 TonB-dependent receptor [Parapedobacter sp. SGR-10]